MKLFTKISLVVMGMLVAAVVAIVGVVYWQVNVRFEEQFRAGVTAQVQLFDRQVGQIAHDALQFAAAYAGEAVVVKAFRLAHEGAMDQPDDPQLARAREMLKESFASVRATYEKQGGSFGLHFHLPTSFSLLRAWNPKQSRSDDLRSFRRMVVEANRAPFAPLQGIEVGVGGFAVRGILSVSDPEDGRHLGTVEMLGEFNSALAALGGGEDGTVMGVYMDAAYLDVATALQDAEKNPVLGGRWVFVRSSDDPLFRTNFPAAELSEPLGEKGIRYLHDGDRYYAISAIRDYAGEPVGRIVIGTPLQVLNSLKSSILLTVGLLGLLVLAVVGAVLAGIFGRIGQQINRLAEALGAGAGQVSAAAGEVASSSQQLAEGANKQASSLEESSTALEEMANMTRNNAASAGKADEWMVATKSAVANGAAAVEQVSRAIGRINQSARETAKIVKTIDEIAFQTNLLALNAAVEAARAGEAGKGFAVVAEEVRNLARRAADAAHNTTELIETSQKQADASVSVVSELSQTFAGIQDISGKVGALVGEIAAASKEQAQGIDQVNEGVSSMDQVVQQTAANAEESASAAEELSSQSEELKSMVMELMALVGGRP